MRQLTPFEPSRPMTMTSREIAELTGKDISNVHRDIRAMLIGLYGEDHVAKIVPEQYRNRHSEYIRENSDAILKAILGDDSNWNHQQWRGFAWERDKRGYVTSFRLDYTHTMTLVAGYNVKLRKAIIDRWQELEAQAIQQAIPQTMPEALRLAAEAIEQRDQLAKENTALQGQLAIAAPKAEALQRIALSDGSVCIQSAAKHLQMRPKDLFRWLQEHQWIYRRAGGSGWLGYQSRIQSGLLEHKVTTVWRSDGSEKMAEQCRITPRGLAKLGELLAQGWANGIRAQMQDLPA